MIRARLGIFNHLCSNRFHFARLAVVLLLSSALVISGCMHFTSLSDEEQSAVLRVSDCPLQVTLKDGSRIRAAAHHYLEVTRPSTFIYVSGTYRIHGEEQGFAGKIEPEAAETLMAESRPVYKFTLIGGATVTCWPDDCVFVDSAGGMGLWLVGTLYQGRSSTKFRGKVENDDVASLEFQKADTPGTGLSMAVGILTVVLVVGLAVALKNLWRTTYSR